MAFRSEAQRQKVLKLVKDGKIHQSQYDIWDKDTPKNIPDRIHKKKETKKNGKKTKN